MTQSKKESLRESATNVAVGYTVAVFSQMLIFPLFGIAMPVGHSLGIAACFTLISLIRNYVIRRLFNKKEIKCG